MPTIFPSLDAYKVARKGAALPKPEQDPLARYVDQFGYWTTGAIQDGDKPLPVVVEIKERSAARKLAEKGGRPLAESDPEMIAMIRDFYEGREKDAPPAFAALLAPKPVPAARK